MSNLSDPTRYQEIRNKIDLNPKDHNAWLQLGNYYMDTGEHSQAEKSFRKVLFFTPGNIEALVNLDRIKRIAGKEGRKFGGIQTDVRTWIEHEIPLWLQLIISFISFGFIFAIAQFQKWEAGDMVWSLWITSLTLGYCYLLAGITSNTISSQVNNVDDILAEILPPAARSGIKFVFQFIGAFLQLIFFTVHFGLFHFVHSFFLNEFFPLLNRPFERLTDLVSFVSISLQTYWPVIVFSFFSSLRKFQRVILQGDPDYTKRPYINVVKIHLSIFAFAGLSFSGIKDWLLPLIFVVYFFPFSATFEILKNRKRKPAEAS
ncbi:MAG TPA: DUF6498-containing protein [Anaerolineaceae bacterium]|nr:DUF6498-containing protein [Anaerolineaceae bacterium]